LQRAAKRPAGHHGGVPVAVHANVHVAAGRAGRAFKRVVGADERDAGASGPVDGGLPQPRGHRHTAIARQEQRLSVHRRLSVRARVRFQLLVVLKHRRGFCMFNVFSLTKYIIT